MAGHLFPLDSSKRPANPVLRGVLLGLVNADESFIQNRVLPIAPTTADVLAGAEGYWTGVMRAYQDHTLFGDPNAREEVAPLEDVPTSIGAQLTSVSFRCREYARDALIPTSDIAKLNDTPSNSMAINAMSAYLSKVITEMMILRERRVAELFFTASNWTNNTTPGTKWDLATSDPIGDIETAVETVAGYGRMPNVCILGRQAYRTLRQSNPFLEFRSTDSDRSIMNAGRVGEVLRQDFGIQHTFVGRAVYNTDQTYTESGLSLSDIWGDNMWIGYLPMGNDGMPSSVGTPMGDGEVVVTPSAVARIVGKEWSTSELPEGAYAAKRARAVRVEHWEDLLVAQDFLGYLLTDVTT